MLTDRAATPRITLSRPALSPACRAAPEMLWGERCTERADIYSYGVGGGWLPGTKGFYEETAKGSAVTTQPISNAMV